MEGYQNIYKRSITDKNAFFREQALELLNWDKPFTITHTDKLNESTWFEDGVLNACYNAVDRHVMSAPEKIALIYDGNNGEKEFITYKHLLSKINEVANFFIEMGLKKGDCVTLYMPVIPETYYCLLACCRLGIVHNAVFGGFSAESLAIRIDDSDSQFVVTVDYCQRENKKLNFLEKCKEALEILEEQENKGNNPVKTRKILVFNNQIGIEGNLINLNLNSEIIFWSDVQKNQKTVPCTSVPAEHPLFYLYTSGSTGKPKGIVHSTAGYLLHTILTTKHIFKFTKDDVFACTADLGWLAANSHSLYGPLLVGGTTIVFGGTPVYPSALRLFQMIEEYNVTHLYTAPTVVRMLRGIVNEEDVKQNLSSLKIVRCVGEPLNLEAYNWLHRVFNKNKGVYVVDTYWQTETGGIMLAPIPWVSPARGECVGVPFLGVDPVILKKDSSSEKVELAQVGEIGHLFFKGSWPGIARSIIKDPLRFKEYFSTGFFYTGDEAYVDNEGFYHIMGRFDDVVNVSGHRLSTVEVERVACMVDGILEAAVVAEDDPITGQSICLFLVTKEGTQENKIKEDVLAKMRTAIGALIRIKRVLICKDLPKTRTGKIMRRILRDILVGREMGDISACFNVECIEGLRCLVV